MRSLHRVASNRLTFLLGFLPALLAGCTDEKIVFREPFNPPPDNTFLGFFDASTSQTTCGNCHVLHQRDWVNTDHASAISLLVGNADATPECYQCHTVSERGNPVDGAAGYNSVQTDVYHDVQCESCHGPGLDHVEFPDAGQTATNPPLAAISVPLLSAPLNSTDSATLANSASCGSCHNQNSGPGVRTYEEWAASGHAVAVTEGPDNCAPACNPSCVQCHEAKGILADWGASVNYREKGSSELLGQTCAVCHDPHGSRKDDAGTAFPGQLRWSMETPDTNANLCMKCHQRRSVPAATSSRGPHAPQGPMLLGDAGYRPVGFDPNVVQTTHASDANPRLCAGCHVNRLTGTDVTTGRPATSAGHLFLAVPCLDAGGLPDLANQDCPHDEASRSWQACTVCHNSAAQGVSLFTLITQRMDADTREIWTDLNANGLVDPDSTACSAGALRIRVQGSPAVTDTIPCFNPDTTTDPAARAAKEADNRANWDAGLLARTDLIPQIGPTAAFPNDTNQYKTNDSFISPAEGALFNVRMLRPDGGTDGSNGVHNPFLAEALLIANIAEINTRYYGGAAALSPAVRSKMSGNMAGLYRSVANAASMQSK